MSSGGWEKVGGSKAKNKGHNNNKYSKTEKKKFAEKAPKLEDVLSADQINGAYGVDDFYSDPVLTESPKPAKKPAENKKKAEQKKKNNIANEAKNEKPKSIEEAAKRILPAELASTLETVRTLYPDNHLLWLKDAAAFFNSMLDSEKSVSLANPFANQPLCFLTKETKRILTSMYEEISDQARQTGFENLLANLAHDLAKDQSGHGYMVLLQSLAEVYPSICVYNTERFRELMRSYRNRAHVGTALVWALGQGGRKDLAIGLRVWTEFANEYLQYKNYTRYVVDYLSGLLEHHASRLKGSGRILYTEQFLKLFDLIFITGQSGIPRDLQAQLAKQYPTIKDATVGNCSADHDLFPAFLKRLGQCLDNPALYPAVMKENVLVGLVDSLSNNRAAIKHWQRMYTSYVPASAELLDFIDSKWSRYGSSLAKNEAISATIAAFEKHNQSVVVQKDGISEASSACKGLLDKMARQGKKGSEGCGGWFPWKTASLFLIFLIVSTVKIDIEENKGFEKSKTGIFLKDIGLDQTALNSYAFCQRYYDKYWVWHGENAPVIREKAFDAIEKARPYAESAKENTDAAYKYASEKTDAMLTTVDKTLPGTKNNVLIAYGKTCDGVVFLKERTIFYGNIMIERLIRGSTIAYQDFQSGLRKFVLGKLKWFDVKMYGLGVWKKVSTGTTEMWQWLTQQAQLMVK